MGNKVSNKSYYYSQTTTNSHNSRPLPYSTTNKREFQHPGQDQRNTLPQPEGPAYWDNLSTIWLTIGALKELDRRNSYPKPRQEYRRPVTRLFDAKRKKGWKPQFAPDFLRDCAPSCLKELERYIALKIFIGSPRENQEVRVLDHLSNIRSNHSGSSLVRKMIDKFELTGPRGVHQCIVYEPLLTSLLHFQATLEPKNIPEDLLKGALQQLLRPGVLPDSFLIRT